MNPELKQYLDDAVLAPSTHNTQPWLFRLADGSVEILADRTRALPVVDPDDRELTISCGALLFNLRIAMRAGGQAEAVEVLPDLERQRDLLARVKIAGAHAASDAERQLHAAIAKRHTYRFPFENKPVPAAAVDGFRQAAEAEGASFLVIDEAKRSAVIQLVMEGDRRQGADRRFRRELASWLHNNRTHSHDGIPGYAMGIGEFASYVGPFVVRTFDWGTTQAIDDRRLAEGSPVLAVIATDHDGPPAWMAAGQALERVLLQAQTQGLSASYLNQPIEVEDLRTRLQGALGTGKFPQLLLRMGYGQTERSTPRRKALQLILP